ncbi:XdhC family protein [Haliangium sp.]|uniref:XdhC family protein n=1 Tax=Haliangium sp. TaxID=2663208 RepID=UPI003D0967B4
MDMLAQALVQAEAGAALALVTVIGVRGSAPRHLGTKMLVGADGATVGTVGGGQVEQEAARLAAEVAAGAPARRLRSHLVSDLAGRCGGTMEFWIEPVGLSLGVLQEAQACRGRRQPAVLITDLTGDLTAPPKRVELRDRLAERHPYCEGEQLIEPLWPPERVILFGAGHVAQAIGRLAAEVDFEVAVCDDDETGALSALGRSSWLRASVDSFDVRDVEATLGPLGLADYVLIVTRDHAMDERILERLLPRDGLAYLGLIGSRRKIGGFRKRLTAKGLASPERWARLRAPIGLDLGAETPAEIAVAVVAQLVHVRRRSGASALDYAPVAEEI